MVQNNFYLNGVRHTGAGAATAAIKCIHGFPGSSAINLTMIFIAGFIINEIAAHLIKMPQHDRLVRGVITLVGGLEIASGVTPIQREVNLVHGIG